MKLTKDTIIEGQIVKKGTEIKINEVLSGGEIEEELDKELIFHSSMNPITKINKDNDLFGDILFFAYSPYNLSTINYVYALDYDKLDIIRVKRFYYDNNYKKLQEVEEEIVEYLDFNVSTDEAQSLLDESKSLRDLGISGFNEFGWFLQRKQGEGAKLMGYDGAESEDEQGTVIMIPMYGREKDLIDVTDVYFSDEL